MHSHTHHNRQPTQSAKDVRSTPSLINEGYTRLVASAAAYRSVGFVSSLSSIHSWLESFGKRLASMAEQLRGEGAKTRKAFEQTAAPLTRPDTWASPRTLLAEAEENQAQVLQAFELLTDRLDMDADLYTLVTAMNEELQEALNDISDMRREYDAYWPGQPGEA